MDCARAAELLPWLLNGTLEAAERDEVALHLEECASCRDELEETELAWLVHAQHVPTPQLVDWALGQPLGAEEARRVERHLEHCEACREELALARRVRDVSVRGAPIRATGAGRSGWRWVALAAGLSAVIAGGGWFWSAGAARRAADRLAALARDHEGLRAGAQRERRETAAEAKRLRERLAALTAPAVNVAVAEIAPELAVRGAEPEATRVVVAAGMSQLVLVLISEDRTQFLALRLDVLDAKGALLWRAEGLERRESGDYTVLLPLDRVPAGLLSLRVLGRRGEGWVRVEDYRLRLEKS